MFRLSTNVQTIRQLTKDKASAVTKGQTEDIASLFRLRHTTHHGILTVQRSTEIH